MKKLTCFSTLLQQMWSHEDMQAITDALEYIEKARKYTAYELFKFFAQAAVQGWNGYRDAENRMEDCDLDRVHYSTISKKAKEVPFEIFKDVLHALISKCSRSTRRSITLPKELLLIDSTTITTGLGRMTWAPLKGSKAGVKLHTAMIADKGELYKVNESVVKCHDIPGSKDLANKAFILVADRAYGSHEGFDKFQKKRQHFIIRLRDNTLRIDAEIKERKRPYGGTIEQDEICLLGAKQNRTTQRFRVISLKDPKGKTVLLATNLFKKSAEDIAEMYRKRWQIEVLFRWIKQHLNIKNLFGTTENAVFSQLFIGLIVYVILKKLFDQGNSYVHPSAKLTQADYVRLMSIDELPPEWMVYFTLEFKPPE